MWFVDVTEESGLDFVHETGAGGAWRLPEIMCCGAALFDFDSDGDLDVYLTNGSGSLDGSSSANGPRNALYRQERNGRFVDATRESGLGDTGYGMGVAVGDIDNDGDADVYLTRYGADRLYRNRGNGTFEERTRAAGIQVDGWTSSAVFFDYDLDGFLDLFVARYVDHDPERRCTDGAGRPDYCSPGVFRPTADILLHNNGDGTFTDVSESAGILGAAGAGLGVVAADLDADGWQDVYVANDGDANRAWINRRDGTFRDDALILGLAYSLDGQAEAGMGVVAGDFDNDLDLDLFLTHLARQTNTLYVNLGEKRGFADSTGPAGLATSSLPLTGFGTVALDVELDGDLDLLIANGRVTRGEPREGTATAQPWSLFAEPNQLYLNRGDGRFEPARGDGDGFLSPIAVSRGLALGDIDGDGDGDVLLSNAQERARLYRNVAPRRGSWLAVRAVDPRYRRDAIGARITVIAGELRQLRFVGGGYGYLSSSDPVALFGLGRRESLERLEVRWPDGRLESFSVRDLNRRITVVRGEGIEAP